MAEPIELKRGERILISHFDRLSLAVLAVPLIETLRMRYPENSLDVLASDHVAPILRNIRHIEAIVSIDKERLQNDETYRDEFLGKIKEAQYQVALVLYPDKILSQLLYEAGIPYRIGTGQKFMSIYFNRHLFFNRDSNQKHESEYNLDYLKFFRQGVLFKTPKIDLSNRELDEAHKLLTLDAIKGDFIVLHPGNGDPTYCWPLKQYIELAGLLSKKEMLVLLTGSEGESANIIQTANQLGIKIRSYAGKTDPLTLAALMSMAQLVVTNAGGPLYLAAAVGSKVIGLYPSEENISLTRWGLPKEGHKIIQPYRGSAIETITVEEVGAVVINTINKAKVEK
jgi:ADP-heptose:LPS heptosyltransferase